MNLPPDTGEFLFWGALAILFYIYSRKFRKALHDTKLNWNPTPEQALEDATRHAAYRNKRGESHLRVVSAGQHGTKDREAIRKL